MIGRAAAVLVALLGAATAAAQTRAPVPQGPPTTSMAPIPMPLAPPTNPGSLPAPRDGLSPLLSQPGPVGQAPQRAGPSYPAPSPAPLAPVDQQKMQGYRNDLLGQRWQLERQGVSPDNQRYREIQQQLNQPSSR
jgi:hypothetical protein